MDDKDLRIQELKAENQKLKEKLEQLKQPKAAVDIGRERLTYRDEKGNPHSEHIMWDIINRLAEYEDLEEQGLLRRLPCKAGDTIYVIPSKVNYDLNVLSNCEEANRVYKQTVDEIRFFPSGQYLLTTCEGVCSALEQFFGITWFLTEQEAQSALEKMKGE